MFSGTDLDLQDAASTAPALLPSRLNISNRTLTEALYSSDWSIVNVPLTPFFFRRGDLTTEASKMVNIARRQELPVFCNLSSAQLLAANAGATGIKCSIFGSLIAGTNLLTIWISETSNRNKPK